MSTLKTLWSDCRLCGRSTHHGVLQQHEEEGDPEIYHEKNTWQIIRCLGCHTVGFRHRNDDYEDVREGYNGNATHAVTTNLFPSVIRNHRKPSGTHHIPELIQKIYLQTLTALSEKAFVLASVGLRATIEATCNHLQISGTNLERRIDHLYKGGHVSAGDKKRLHAIRFLGNDAAHEIKEPRRPEIIVALEIVEHMLNSVFILPKKAKSLETVIESYPDFLCALKECIKNHTNHEAISLAGLLGRQRRLVAQMLDEFEARLKSDIQIGNFTDLKLGSMQSSGGKDVQLYEVLGAQNSENTDSPS